MPASPLAMQEKPLHESFSDRMPVDTARGRLLFLLGVLPDSSRRRVLLHVFAVVRVGSN